MEQKNSHNKHSIERQFQKLDSRRHNKLTRARDCARLTVPTLFPREGFTESMELPDLFNSMPARGVMSLASRIVSAMYPLNQMPFFSFELDSAYVPQGADITETVAALSRLDKKIMNKLSHSNLRQELFVLMQHLIVLGDALFEIQDDFNFRVHRVDHYVIQRYPDGKIKKMILREWVDPEAVPDEWKDAMEKEEIYYPKDDEEDKYENGNGYENGYDSFTMSYNNQYAPSKAHKAFYTMVEWEPETKTWECYKEYCGYIIDKGEFTICPYIPQSWSRIAGEDYGRSLIEEHIGDIRTLEALSKSLCEAAMANSEHRIGIDPTGITEVQDLIDTQNGDFVPARSSDIFSIQLLRQIDLGPMASIRQDLTAGLGRVFLLNSSVQRDAERVTATEIRMMASELDQSLGGIFSGIAASIQIPIVKRTVLLMARDKLLPPDIVRLIQDDGLLSLKVRTGLEALNREVEASQLMSWMSVVAPNQSFAPFIDNYGLLVRLSTSMGLDPVGIVKTPQQLQEEQAAQARQSIDAMAAQQAISSMGSLMETGGMAAMEQQMAQQPQ